MRLLLIVFILIVFYYLFTKYIFPFLLRLFIRKAAEHFQQFSQPGYSPPSSVKEKEGDVTVKYVPPVARKKGFDAGTAEDVNFEEISDTDKK